MSDLISRQALCEYALNQKDKSVTPNDIMRFPSAQPERMRFVQQAVNTIMHIARSDSIKDKSFRNAARMIQNAIDGEPQDFEPIPDEPEPPCYLGSPCEYQNKDIKLQSAQPHWIPCSERLPEANGRYLVTRGLNACGAMWNRVYIINYSDLMGLKSERIWWGGNVGKSDFERFDDVIAWMPLPKPYGGDAK